MTDNGNLAALKEMLAKSERTEPETSLALIKEGLAKGDSADQIMDVVRRFKADERTFQQKLQETIEALEPPEF